MPVVESYKVKKIKGLGRQTLFGSPRPKFVTF